MRNIGNELKVLIACEESQAVCKEFRAWGHEAYSCDILPTSGEHPEWHIQGDVLNYLNDGWDMIIGFPPCTYMTNGGAVRMYPKKGEIDQDRYQKAMEAKEFFMAIYNASAQYIAIENPLPMKVIGLPPRTQMIQPYQFGDPYSKKTCLWLKNLPELVPTNVLTEYQPFINGGGGRMNRAHYKGKKFAAGSIARSKTFPGIARAMAQQWSRNINWGHQNQLRKQWLLDNPEAEYEGWMSI